MTLIHHMVSRLLISFLLIPEHSWIFCHKILLSVYSLWIQSFLKMLWSLVSTVLKYFLFYSEQLPYFWFKSTQSCLPSNYIRLLLPNPLSVQINSICMHIILFRISQTCASYFMMNWISCFDVSMFLINFFFIQGLYLYISVVLNFFVIWYLNCDLVCLRWTKRQMPKIWHL